MCGGGGGGGVDGRVRLILLLPTKSRRTQYYPLGWAILIKPGFCETCELARAHELSHSQSAMEVTPVNAIKQKHRPKSNYSKSDKQKTAAKTGKQTS